MPSAVKMRGPYARSVHYRRCQTISCPKRYPNIDAIPVLRPRLSQNPSRIMAAENEKAGGGEERASMEISSPVRKVDNPADNEDEGGTRSEFQVDEPLLASYAGDHVDSPVSHSVRETADTTVDEQGEVPPATSGMQRLLFLIQDNPIPVTAIVAAGGFLILTFVVALVRTFLKGMTNSGRRSRVVNKNKMVVDEISNYLPSRRDSLKGGTIMGLRLRTGFSSVEIFRKYLWFLLRERKFDTEAVADVKALKDALGLTDIQVAEALTERAKRVYKKYGSVMLDTSGMTSAGVERKATARALFSKLLYLADCEDILGSDAAEKVDLREIFGATEDDIARLRIPSLYEVDLDAIMMASSAEESDAVSLELEETTSTGIEAANTEKTDAEFKFKSGDFDE